MQSLLHTNRLLTQRRNAERMPQSLLGIVDIVVGDRRMRRHSVIPEHYRTVVPFHSDLDVGGLRDVLSCVLD